MLAAVFCQAKTLVEPTWDFGLAFDAGSTGTRLYIYRWHHQDTGKRKFIRPETKPEWTKKLEQGIAHFAREPEGIGHFLQPLLHWAEQVIQSQGVERSRFQNFPIYLKATAGMRLLPYHLRDPIMVEVRKTLARSPFFFEHDMARVISGEEEGIYGWLTVNYFKGTLFDGRDSYGVVDLGGDSVEISFCPVHDVLDDFFPLRLKGKNIRMYTHSFLGFGVKEVGEVLQSMWPLKLMSIPLPFPGSPAFEAKDL